MFSRSFFYVFATDHFYFPLRLVQILDVFSHGSARVLGSVWVLILMTFRCLVNWFVKTLLDTLRETDFNGYAFRQPRQRYPMLFEPVTRMSKLRRCLHKSSRPPNRLPVSNSSRFLRYLRTAKQGEIFMPASTDERSVSLSNHCQFKAVSEKQLPHVDRSWWFRQGKAISSPNCQAFMGTEDHRSFSVVIKEN